MRREGRYLGSVHHATARVKPSVIRVLPKSGKTRYPEQEGVA